MYDQLIGHLYISYCPNINADLEKGLAHNTAY